MEESKQSEMIKTALENVKSLFDANTITGTPMELKNGVLIIPVSKIYVGVATGGANYSSKKSTESSNFGGGLGTGLTVSPLGFLVVYNDSRVELLDFSKAPKDITAQLIEFIGSSGEIFDKFKSLFLPKTDSKDNN
jgi:sporulation protein YtfJ